MFDNKELEGIILFKQDYKIMVDASGTLIAGGKTKYLCTLLHEEELREFENICDKIRNTTLYYAPESNPIGFRCVLFYYLRFL